MRRRRINPLSVGMVQVRRAGRFCPLVVLHCRDHLEAMHPPEAEALAHDLEVAARRADAGDMRPLGEADEMTIAATMARPEHGLRIELYRDQWCPDDVQIQIRGEWWKALAWPEHARSAAAALRQASEWVWEQRWRVEQTTRATSSPSSAREQREDT